MATIKLNATTRKATGHKVTALRAAGVVPAVTYGHGIEPVSIEINGKELEKVVADAGTSTVVDLVVDGTTKNVVIHDVQRDPVSNKLIHADLYQVRMDEKITAEVPLKFTGVSAAVKDFGGILVKAADSLEVEALPKDLPHEIVVDLSRLAELNASITLADLSIPEGVEVLVEDKEFSIASVTPPRSEEELAALDEAVTEDVDAVEGVKPEEEEEGAEGEGEAEARPEEGEAKEATPEAKAEKPEK